MAGIGLAGRASGRKLGPAAIRLLVNEDDFGMVDPHKERLEGRGDDGRVAGIASISASRRRRPR
jgi:hypothetical protein